MRRFRTFGETKKRGGIPDDCYEVEWIESTGTQYIDTGIPWNSSLNISAEFSPMEDATVAMYCVWGARDSTSGSQGNCFGLSNTGKFRSDNNGTRITSSASYAVGGHYTVTKDGSSVMIGGDATDSMTAALNPNVGVSHITIFSLNENGDATKYRTKFRLYSFAVRGRLDLVPVRREEDGVSVGYMCDRLTGTLYGNAGSGSFVIGPDKYDAEVEYLESVEARKAGSQITFPVGDRATFECKLHIFDTIDLKFMGLMYNEGGAYQGCFQISTILGGYRTQAPFMGTLSVDTPPVDITRPIVYKSPDPNHLYWTIDGVQYPVGACRWNTAGNFHLFHAGVLNYWNDKGRNRLYWCKVYEDGVLTRDFIPVRYRGVGYMYDNVSGRLFGNQGSGEFVIGADVKHAKDYVQDGLVAMWDGIENAGWGVHDESATYWADLVSDLRMSPLSDSYYQPGDMYGSFTTQCTQLIPKELWGGDHVKNITQSALVDMDSVASNAFFTLLYCYASPAAYRYGINTNASRRLTGDHITMLSTADSALYTQGIHRFDHVVSENTSGGTDEKLYIDGVEIVSARKTTAFSATETTQMRFYFYANIRAYNMMHYKRALTDAEIAANYAVDKVRFGI